MKKKLKMMAMLLCVTAFVGLSSCTKDDNASNDNDPNGYKELIIGRWRCTYDRDGGSSSIGMIWEFKTNGTWTTTDRNDVMYGREVEYKINGNTLSFLDGAMSYTINKLTSEDLELSGMNHLKFTKRSGSGTNKSASAYGNRNWNSSYASATKAHSLMFSEGEDTEIR